jgi:hypothetical protein
MLPTTPGLSLADSETVGRSWWDSVIRKNAVLCAHGLPVIMKPMLQCPSHISERTSQTQTSLSKLWTFCFPNSDMKYPKGTQESQPSYREKDQHKFPMTVAHQARTGAWENRQLPWRKQGCVCLQSKRAYSLETSLRLPHTHENNYQSWQLEGTPRTHGFLLLSQSGK